MENQEDSIFYCSEPVQVQSEFPESCDGNGGCCNSTNDDFFSPSNITENCFCTSNATKSGVCPLFPGDEPLQLAIKQVMNWHKSDAIKNCNSDKREYISCAQEMWDSVNYQNLINYLSYVQFYPINLQFNKCVKSALTTNLYGKMSNYLTSYRFSSFNPIN
ncbi:unnamed protein product [Blepharisma stoltei]|uniref:Uncharacterized protein n=1 Tax=Blepharisma stoltei TaxID=1481888 RepID=A0AAU9K999_9CILI|nr:unnamed protein product [Blepharisma stoltei]